MKKAQPINSVYIFVLAIFFTLLINRINLLYFAPFLVLSYYSNSCLRSCWLSVGSGIIIDLFSSTSYFGLTAVNYCLATFLLYGQTRHFFRERMFTIPIMTLLFSLLSSCISIILRLLFSQPIHISARWVLTDLIGMSFFDAFYAFSVVFPAHMFYKFQRSLRVKRRAQ